MKEQGRVLLADRILSGCRVMAMPGSAGEAVCPTIAKSISESEIIEISEIADFYFDTTHNSDKVAFDAFPNVAPPFPKFFVEMKAHPSVKLERAGLLVTADKISRKDAELEYKNSPASKRGMPFNWIEGVTSPEEDVWSLNAIAIGYLGINGGFAFPIFYTTSLVSMRGQLASRYNPVWSLGDDTLTKNALTVYAEHILNPAWFAISFLHCRNVKTVENTPPAKLSKAFQRRHGRPLLRYHTLEIEPMKKVLETEGGIGHNGLKKALHICRGHFATYTPDKPLFGRVVGTVWKPAHVRGDSQHGIVAKDYKIKAA